MPHIVYEALRLLYLATLIGACSYAFWRGGEDERIGAGIQLASSLASLPAAWLAGRSGWQAGHLPLLAVDLLTLVAFVWLAMRSRKFWPLWVAGFHLNAVLTHLAKLLAPTALPAGYALVQGFWAYPLMAALIVGTRNQSRMRHRHAQAV
ncbi:hypothetical protein ACFSCW_14330 [Sphingomonas tabacisoli]|uniref:DUF4345 domain-containing protein n=1 Tax=Sphingomonas tabacisoli TaxID=2249466 RepID=A0ABW4I858_9SPHN